jgi:hypothetical protein
MLLMELAAWAVRRRNRWRVTGTSMEPDFADGDIVLIEPVGVVAPAALAGVGDAVIARHPFKNIEVIKWVASVDPDDHLQLRSPSGDDSRQFGRVPLHTVRGRVSCNLTQRHIVDRSPRSGAVPGSPSPKGRP